MLLRLQLYISIKSYTFINVFAAYMGVASTTLENILVKF